MSKVVTLTGKNSKIAYKMLEDITTILEEHDIRYWLDFGTLLGVVREQRLLPWDHDMDIAIKEDDASKVQDIMPLIKKAHYRTYERYVTNTYQEHLKQGDINIFKFRNNKLCSKIRVLVLLQKNDDH